MNPEYEQLEGEIDRQLVALAPHLGSPPPRPGSVADLKAAVGAEAGRLRRRERRLVALRPWVGVAAAVLLAVGLSLPRRPDAPGPALGLGENADAILADWVDALGESGEQFTRLLEEDWLLEGFAPGPDENDESGDPLDSLEESLESFQRMIEA